MRAIDGESTWDIYGISYGTRVALELMRLDPGRLHAVVLDSVYPPDIHFELVDPWLLERAFGLLERVCDLVGDCTYSAGEIAQQLRRALAVLERAPMRIRARDPYAEGELDVVIGAEDFAWLLFEALYRWDRLADLPDLIAAVADGRQSSTLDVLVQDSLATQLDPGFSDAVASAVDCNDAYPLEASEMSEMMSQFARVANLVEYDWEFHFCRFWKTTDPGVDFRRPVKSDVPTLILAGEFDPVTPPLWAESVAKHLENAVLFQFPGVGHGVLDSHECALELVNAFLKAPLSASPPECLDAL
jgi:pimeloyl-ACP methyl ester carboxylesterase